MKKVAIVGVEGSGKTVMLAGLGELYSHPDENGYFMQPKNFATASYVTDKIQKMRSGSWPSATAEDVLQGLDWTIRHKKGAGTRPTDICAVSCLDFAGEVYRTAFGIKSEDGSDASDEVQSLKDYIAQADDVIVLINLRDVISKGLRDPRVQESMWITNSILTYALEKSGRKREPRASIVLTQADSYADTIVTCGGAQGVLEKYLPHVANNYGWLDIMSVSAVDRTMVDDEGNVIPVSDFQLTGLKPVVEWILKGAQVSSGGKGTRQSKWNQNASPAAEGADGHESSNQIRSKTGDEKVNVVLFGLALLVAAGMAILCFATEHWWAGGVLAFVCLGTTAARGDKKTRQGAGSWILYTVVLFLSGCVALADLGWLSIVLAFGGLGILTIDEKK